MLRLREEQIGVLTKELAARNLIASIRTQGLEATWHPEVNQVVARDGKGNPSKLTLDHRGCVIAHTTPLGRTFNFTYDVNSRLSSIATPADLTVSLTYDDRGLVEHVATSAGRSLLLSWDERGSLTKGVLPDGSSVRMSYDERARLRSYTDRAGRTAVLDWDSRDRLTSITDFGGHRTSYDYGRWDRPRKIVHPDGTWDEIIRNESGRPTALIVNGNLWAAIESDSDARVTKLSYADGHYVALTYDQAGKVIEARNPTITVKRQYDDGGRLVREDQGGEVVTYEYDARGLLKTLTSPNAPPIHFDYDADARLVKVVDWNGEPQEFLYEPSDRVVHQVMPNGRKTTTEMSRMGSLVEVDNRSAVRADGSAVSLRFSWDDTGKLVQLDDSETGIQTFAYDAEGRVTAVRGRSQEGFAYDVNGNRISANGESAQYDSRNRLLRQGVRDFEYDARGNVVAELGPNGTTRYTYNGQNLLIGVDLPDGRRIVYSYDALARLVWRQSGGQKTRYIWAGDQLLAEISDGVTGSERRDYIFIPHSFCPLLMRKDGAVYYYVTDHRGVPRWLLDRQGQVAWSASYAAFGEAKILRGRVQQPVRLSGHYYDPDTGLHYCRARYYSPRLGRYLSPDPLDVVSGLNLYIYAENDPIKKSDPLGLITFWQGVAAAAMVVAGAAILAVAIPVVAAAVVAVAKGAAVAAGTAAAAMAVVGGAALVGAGIGLAVAPEKASLKCKIHYALRGAAIGAGAAIGVMGAAFGAAGIVAAGGGGGMLLAGGPALVASTDAVRAGAAGVIAGAITMATGGSGGGGDDEGGDEDEDGKQDKADQGEKKRLKAKDRRKQEQDRAAEGKGKTEGTPRNNQAQNREFDDAARGLTKDQRRQLHDEITKKNYTREEIIEIRNQMFPDNPYPSG